jgi:hypothetical protein
MDMDLSSTPFELIFDRNPEGCCRWGACLKSPLLDPLMHRDSTVRVMFGDTARQDSDKELLVDSFQLGSLISYLQEQSNLKRAIQDALHEHVKQWHLEGAIGNGEDVWRNVCVGEIGIDRPRLRLAQTDLSTSSIEEGDNCFAKRPARLQKLIEARQNRPLPATAYSLILESKWQDGHQRRIEVENGKFVKLVVDG